MVAFISRSLLLVAELAVQAKVKVLVRPQRKHNVAGPPAIVIGQSDTKERQPCDQCDPKQRRRNGLTQADKADNHQRIENHR